MVRCFAWGAIAVGAAFAFGSYLLSDQEAKYAAFISGLLLNLAAEFVGIGVAILVGAKLAHAALQDRFSWLLPSLIDVIKQARADGNITSPTAQRSVIAVVTLLRERNPKQDSDLRDRIPNEPCAVCGLDSKVTRKAGKACCAQCGLQGSLWCKGQRTNVSPEHPPTEQS